MQISLGVHPHRHRSRLYLRLLLQPRATLIIPYNHQSSISQPPFENHFQDKYPYTFYHTYLTSFQIQINIRMYFCSLVISVTLFSISQTFTPEIIQLQLKIAELSYKNQILSQKRYQNESSINPPSTDFLLKYQLSQLNLHHECQFKDRSIRIVSFQTTEHLYFAVNFPSKDTVQIFNSQCTKISTLHQLQISLVFSDRGVNLNGIVYLLTQDKTIVKIEQNQKFKTAVKLLQVSQQSEIVGGVARYRGQDKVQLFIAFKDGMIRVFDEGGKNKLNLFLQGNKAEIKIMIDHHPYPLIATTSNWISMLDTNRYVDISQHCPYIPNILHIVSQNFYGESTFVISDDKIFAFTFDLNKKQCKIKKQFPLPIELKQSEKTSFYGNCIFLDQNVYNLTEKRLYSQKQCKQSYLQFAIKRSANSKQLCLKTCCQNNECSIEVLSIVKAQDDKSIFIYITVCFIIILVICLSLMKTTNTNKLDIYEQKQNVARNYTEEKLLDMSKRNVDKKGKNK